MSPTKPSKKRATKAKKAPTRRRVANKLPAKKPMATEKEQWQPEEEPSEMEHERIQHPWPETEKEPMGQSQAEDSNQRQQNW